MEKVPRLLRSPFHSSARIHRPANPIPLPHRRTPVPLKRPKRRKLRPRIPSRSVSEPILWTVRMFVPDNEEFVGINENRMFPRHHTCTDVFSPLMRQRSISTTPRDSIEEAKVVVSVVVERSPGPVRAMVRLGASVEEVIEVIVKKYCREGRSPRLSRDGTASFELHYSNFSLQSNRGVVSSERKGTGRSVSWSLLFERRAERLEEGLRFVLYRDGRPAGSGKEKRVHRGYAWGGRSNDAREWRGREDGRCSCAIGLSKREGSRGCQLNLNSGVLGLGLIDTMTQFVSRSKAVSASFNDVGCISASICALLYPLNSTYELDSTDVT